MQNTQAQKELLEFSQASMAVHCLQTARLALLGHRTVGMTEVTFHEYDIKEIFGPIVVYWDSNVLLQKRQQITPDHAQPLWDNLKARAGRCQVTDADGLRSLRCFLALRQWAQIDSIAGIAVGCYPDLMGEVCLACGLLAEENIVISCEGDINSLILTYALHHINNAPTHNTDLLHVDENDDTMILSHCGNSALSLAGPKSQIALDSVRLMGQGAVSLYPAPPGQVTLANLCGKKGSYRLTCATAQALDTDMVFPGIPVKVKAPCPVASFLRQTADFGTGHHWIIAYGDLRPQLEYFCKALNIKILNIS